ncbi:iron-sulfur cluster assembly scaffold protein [Alphaproteobacteria bacterium LSUCC0684]
METEKLYQEKILAFAREARQHGLLDEADHHATVSNPTCGDRVRLDLRIAPDNTIRAVGAKADGCALCEAATGLALATLIGRDAAGLSILAETMEAWLAGRGDAPDLEDCGVFTPVKDYSSRHSCVCLPFRAAAKAVSPDAD